MNLNQFQRECRLSGIQAYQRISDVAFFIKGLYREYRIEEANEGLEDGFNVYEADSDTRHTWVRNVADLYEQGLVLKIDDSQIHYHVGDLFDNVDESNHHFDIIPHCCNNIGRWGAGFVIPLAQNFPEAKDRYLRWHEESMDFENGKAFALGNVQFVHPRGSRVIVANMIGQNGVRGPDNPTPIDYAALTICIYSVMTFAMGLQSQNVRVQIHAPMFGAGLAGGDWSVIKKIISNYWNPFETTVYALNREELVRVGELT